MYLKIQDNQKLCLFKSVLCNFPPKLKDVILFFFTLLEISMSQTFQRTIHALLGISQCFLIKAILTRYQRLFGSNFFLQKNTVSTLFFNIQTSYYNCRRPSCLSLLKWKSQACYHFHARNVLTTILVDFFFFCFFLKGRGGGGEKHTAILDFFVVLLLSFQTSKTDDVHQKMNILLFCTR